MEDLLVVVVKVRVAGVTSVVKRRIANESVQSDLFIMVYTESSPFLTLPSVSQFLGILSFSFALVSAARLILLPCVFLPYDEETLKVQRTISSVKCNRISNGHKNVSDISLLRIVAYKAHSIYSYYVGLFSDFMFSRCIAVR